MRSAQRMFWMLLVPMLPLVACGEDDDDGGGGVTSGNGGASGVSFVAISG